MVVGLEVHCELQTATKLFCGCPNAFGDEPNTNVCPVCLGLPGSLPVLNRQAVELAMRIGTALHCEIRPSSFHRKNYFYPDMPKDYQISQYDEPINVGGWLDLPDGSRVGVDPGPHGGGHRQDHPCRGRRAHPLGRPLPGRLQPLRRALGGDRERARHALGRPGPGLRRRAAGRPGGHRRLGRPDGGGVDAGRRQRLGPAGRPTAFGTRCEIKNLNSLRSLARAIEYEAARQVALHRGGRAGRPGDPALGRGGRPDRHHALEGRGLRLPLLPRARPGAGGPDAEWRAAGGRAPSGPLPAERRARLVELLGGDGHRGPGRPGAGRGGPGAGRPGGGGGRAGGARPPWPWPGRPTRWRPTSRPAGALDPAAFAALLGLEAGGQLSATQAKEVLAELLAAGGGTRRPSPGPRGSRPCPRTPWPKSVRQVVEANPDEWARFRDGDDGERKLGRLLHRPGHEGHRGQGQRQSRGGRAGSDCGAEGRPRPARPPWYR